MSIDHFYPMVRLFEIQAKRLCFKNQQLIKSIVLNKNYLIYLIH